ncbi:MAG: hypothetical protein C4K58_05260 [Flavobacteriaceae bacterium]|nr:MAG: hypothetical protein C4K58_05260 [Flavobacteriaceae bacterium]
MILMQLSVLARFSIRGMAIFPFILVSRSELKKDPILINHEKIHLRQQLEMLVVFFYLFYTLEFLYHLLMLNDKNQAYLSISFEKEAYYQETDLGYLKTRPFWAFRKYY